MTKVMNQAMNGAGGLAMLLGLMSALVGSLTLLGLKDPGYITLDWLIVYNVVLGAFSIAVGWGIRKHRPWSPKAAAGIFASHFGVLGVVLVLATSSAAAPESVRAMVFRSVLWAGIAIVVWKGLRTRSHSL